MIYMITWRWARSVRGASGPWSKPEYDFTTEVSDDLARSWSELNYGDRETENPPGWERGDATAVSIIQITKDVAEELIAAGMEDGRWYG